jgi:hypothetical protein
LQQQLLPARSLARLARLARSLARPARLWLPRLAARLRPWLQALWSPLASERW